MNYFAHGRTFVDQPYRLAGVATPDWLSILNRRVRARSKYAAPFLGDDDERVAQIAQGVTQHHDDDRWFHQTAVFVELNFEFTARLRELMPDDDGLRPRFLGHILIELLLDAELIQEDRSQLDRYYESMRSLDFDFVESAVSQMTNAPATNLRTLIPRFCDERFLYDYGDDGKLLRRLNQVMRRVKLAPLPDTVVHFFPEARQRVAANRAALLASPT